MGKQPNSVRLYTGVIQHNGTGTFNQGDEIESASMPGTGQGEKKTRDLVVTSKIYFVLFCSCFFSTSYHLMFAGRGRGDLCETRLPSTQSTSHTSEVMLLGVNHFLWQQRREEPWCEVTSRASAVCLRCHCWIRWWPALAEDIQRRWLSSASSKHMLSPGVSARLLGTFWRVRSKKRPSHFLHYPSQPAEPSIGGVNTLYAPDSHYRC